MQRWQYRIVNIGAFFAAGRLVDTLGSLGSEGWELVTIYDKSSNWLNGMENGFALFKRSVADGEEPDGAWAAALSPRTPVETVKAVQVALDRRKIVAPGAAEALGAVVLSHNVEGVARVGRDGTHGVVAMFGDEVAVWSTRGGDVERIRLAAFQSMELAGNLLMLRSESRDELCIFAMDQRVARNWSDVLRNHGISERAGQ